MDKRAAGLLNAIAASRQWVLPKRRPRHQLLGRPHTRTFSPPFRTPWRFSKPMTRRALQPPPTRVSQYYEQHHQWYSGGYYGPPCRWLWGRPYWKGYEWEPSRVRVYY